MILDVGVLNVFHYMIFFLLKEEPYVLCGSFYLCRICQGELGFTCDQLVRTADNLMAYKYIVKNVARFNGKTATFMPKPIYGDNGSGLHVHQSLWANGKNLFFDSEGYYYKLSKMAMYYLGGILKHAPAILAFTNPSTNSYKRLVPGYEAPCNLFYSKGEL